AAVRHDYQAFARGELPLRQMLSYPPFAGMIRLVIRGPVEDIAHEFAGHVANRLQASLEAVRTTARVLGPAPAPFSKLRGNFRFQIQLQGIDRDALRAATREATRDLKPPEDVQWIVDVDPIDML
ncbi:MAG: primosomal protein N', partial [Thermoguttaceae bacterium]|nr:primosomal protein N' [Thermoguttaceae bacterium]